MVMHAGVAEAVGLISSPSLSLMFSSSDSTHGDKDEDNGNSSMVSITEGITDSKLVDGLITFLLAFFLIPAPRAADLSWLEKVVLHSSGLSVVAETTQGPLSDCDST